MRGSHNVPAPLMRASVFLLFTSLLVFGSSYGLSKLIIAVSPEDQEAAADAETKPAAISAPLPAPPALAFASREELTAWLKPECQRGHSEAVIAAYREVKDEAARTTIVDELVADRRSDFKVVARLIQSEQPSKDWDKRMTMLLAVWFRMDALEALQLTETLPPERLHNYQLNNVGPGLATLPADRVAAFANRLDDQTRAALAGGLTEMLNQSGSARNTQRILDLMKAWHSQDAIPDCFVGTELGMANPAQLEQRISSETDSDRRDLMINGYTRNFEHQQPLKALEWDMKITSHEMRAEEQHRHLIFWLERQRDAALAWLKSGDGAEKVAANVRTSLLNIYREEAAK